MRDWQIAVMEDNWERSTEEAWEKLNEPDPAEDEMQEAAGYMKQALEHTSKACIHLAEAVDALSGYPMENVVQSLYDELLDLELSIRQTMEKYERGERD